MYICCNRSTRERTLLKEREEPPDATYTLFHVPETAATPLLVTVLVNKVELPTEVDTGTSESIISETTYDTLWSDSQRPTLKPSSRKLRTYTGEELKIRGYLDMTVTYGEQSATLPLLVVAGQGPTLLGRDWLTRICLDWSSPTHKFADGTRATIYSIPG